VSRARLTGLAAAAGTAAAVVARRLRRGHAHDERAWAPDPPRATTGPLVSDEQWAEDRRYVAAGLRPLDAGGRRLEVIDIGDGEPILYIPLMSHVEVVYARQLRDFGRDHRAVLFRREEPTDRAVGIAERVEEALAVLDALGIEKAHIVGRGQASLVAAAVALAHPGRSRSRVMVNVGMRHRVPPILVTHTINWALLHLPIEHRLIREESWRRQVVTFLSGPDQRLTRHQLLSVYREIPNFIEVCKYSVSPLELDHDLRETAKDLNVPALLLGADEDPRASREDLEELAAALPDCRGVHMVAQGGRFVNYIQGDEVNRLIHDFYASLSREPELAL
jgi:pimeloyl-ACP methyl ester carboxylesterase